MSKGWCGRANFDVGSQWSELRGVVTYHRQCARKDGQRVSWLRGELSIVGVWPIMLVKPLQYPRYSGSDTASDLVLSIWVRPFLCVVFFSVSTDKPNPKGQFIPCSRQVHIKESSHSLQHIHQVLPLTYNMRFPRICHKLTRDSVLQASPMKSHSLG